MTSISRQAIVDEARSYLGCPFKHRGRTRNGIDCVGLPIAIGWSLGLHKYEDEVEYTRQSTGHVLLKPFLEHCERLSNPALAQDGDILILRDQLFPHHTAIRASNGEMITLIHACVWRGRVVEDVFTDEYRSKLVTVFKFRSL
jgi:cell wall-associated NlpC family hydrolase